MLYLYQGGDTILDFAREVYDRVIFMEDGKILEIGDPNQIFDNPKQEKTKIFLSQVL